MRFGILGELKAIAETMGIQNALGLVEVLKQKREATVLRWEKETGSLETKEEDSESEGWYLSTMEVITTDEV